MSAEQQLATMRQENLRKMGADHDFQDLTKLWVRQSIRHTYAYNFDWLGRPVIQVPQDIYAVQELIWTVKPDLIIETGVAHGGSLILSASMLAMIDYCEAATAGRSITPGKSHRHVIGIDIDIRPHNRAGIEGHPLSPFIELIQGSSTDPGIVEHVRTTAKAFKTVMVFLDSNHTHAHVLDELHAYAPLVSPGSYCVVWDSGVEDLPEGFVKDRPWGKGDNPKTALFAYLKELGEKPAADAQGRRLSFEIDKTIEHKLMITASTDGFLRRL